MPLETATYISDLNVANPAHTDGLSQADSHMRLLKSTVKATFPNFTAAALTSTQAQLDAAVASVTGAGYTRIPLGTAALPGLTPISDPNTGLWSPAADQLAFSLNGTQVLLMGGSALVTTLGIAASAFTTTGAYSGGTGQLVPIGAVLEWYDDVLPTEGGYAWANGQIIASANTVCPILLARWGTRFGGNGTTTMGVPDRRDTVGVGKSTMGGVASRALISAAGFWANVTLGALIGTPKINLSTSNLPAYTPAGTINNGQVLIGGAASINYAQSNGVTYAPNAGANVGATNVGSSAITQQPSTFVGAAQGGTAANVDNVQSSTTCNYILRIG